LIAAAVLAALALLVAPPHAHGNFVYWANEGQSSIGRAKINGTGTNNAFITGLSQVNGVAVDSQFIYWTQGTGATSSIGRANLDGSGANPNFVPHAAGVQDFDPGAPAGIAVNSTAIFWNNTGSGTMGRANIDGSAPTGDLFLTGPDPSCGIAADQSFVYWLDTGLGQSVGRATTSGGNRQTSFVAGIPTGAACGVAVDPSFLYWGSNPGPTSRTVGRASLGGGPPDNRFIPSAVPAANNVCGVAVNSQYVFWANSGPTDSIGRANINGSAPNPNLIAGPTDPCLPAAAPSNKITLNSVKKNKKKGTAILSAKVPGPGQVTLNQANTPPDVNATAAGVKQVSLTIGQASSFSVPVKPVGKTAKKLSKQIKKQLRKKRKAKAKASVTVYIHFVPAGVAGVPNTQQLKVTLVRQKTKKKKK
jgi:hypothetical protein